ncbi:MAG: hypothetical protein ACRENP_18925 [Longimicrobiales bacterium]
MIVCLWADGWRVQEREEAVARLLAEAPRLALSADVIWVDGRGFTLEDWLPRLTECASSEGVCVRVGAASVPIVAQVAARTAEPNEPRFIVQGEERAFLAGFALEVLQIDESLRLLLNGVGLETCGALAQLEREAVEVRFGPELLEYWRQARGQDDRRLFAPAPAELPHASIDFIDYAVADAERLIFAVNSMVGGLCAELQAHGAHARRMLLTLSLEDGQTWERVLRPARPTSSRAVWLRLARALLERITVLAAIRGITLVVADREAAHAVQGDLFDAGFATASAVDAALERLIEGQGPVVAEREASLHPLVEQRSKWENSPRPMLVNAEIPGNTGLELQLLPEPREVVVETVRRRDHHAPVRFRDGKWQQLLTVAGPDRISGGRWEQPYAREYFRAVTVEGMLVWLFRDARKDLWYLHGWWD